MKQKRMLADVLWEAANTWLMSSTSYDPRGEYYSCCALGRAISPEEDGLTRRVAAFVRRLGCDPLVGGFDDLPYGEPRQGARYMWLLLAMHVAEDEGVTL